MSYFHLFAACTFFWFLFMTWLSHQDGEQTGKASRDLARALRFLDADEADLNGKLRHFAHIFVFLVLALLFGAALLCGGYPLPWLAVVFVWCWADEATKPLVPGRHFSWADVGLNALGAAAGCACIAALRFV